MQLKNQILVGAGGQVMQGEAESWVGAVGEKAKEGFITLCTSLMGCCRRDRVGLSSEVPSDETRGIGPKCNMGNCN